MLVPTSCAQSMLSVFSYGVAADMRMLSVCSYGVVVVDRTCNSFPRNVLAAVVDGNPSCSCADGDEGAEPSAQCCCKTECWRRFCIVVSRDPARLLDDAMAEIATYLRAARATQAMATHTIIDVNGHSHAPLVPQTYTPQ